jgi:RsiW-degrading membrane proteinase PrsW (M82 family)
MAVVTIILCVLPALFAIRYFLRAAESPHERRTIEVAFAIGVFSYFVVLICGFPFRGLSTLVENPFSSAAILAFTGAAVPEEAIRLLLLLLLWRNMIRSGDARLGIVYGASLALGYATAETIGYAVPDAESWYGAYVATSRLATATASHAFAGASMGILVSLRWAIPERRRLLLLLAFAVPMLTHGFYDFTLILSEATPSSVPVFDAGSRRLLTIMAYLVVALDLEIAYRLYRYAARRGNA